MLYGLLEILPDLMALGDLFFPLCGTSRGLGRSKDPGGRNLPCHARLWGRPKTFKDERRPLELENARAIYHEALVADDLETVLPFMNLIRAAGKAAPLIKEWKEALIKLQGYARNEVAIPYAKAWNGLLHRLADRLEEESLRQEIFSFSFLAGRAVSLCGIIPKSAGPTSIVLTTSWSTSSRIRMSSKKNWFTCFLGRQLVSCGGRTFYRR